MVGCNGTTNRFDPEPNGHPLEGVLKDVKFCLGGDSNNCRVEFTDGRVFCFDNGEGYLFQIGKTNRIYRFNDGRMIDAVEINPNNR